MSTPNEKIAAGLAARGNGKTTISISHLKGAPRALSDLNGLADQAQSKSNRLAELVSGVESHMTAYEARKRREFDSLPIDKVQKAKALREALKQERVQILAVGKEERDTLLSDLQDVNAKIQAVKTMWADPVGILVRSSLGSEKADRYRRDLAASGPVAVEQALSEAILRADKDLAAACFSRIDAMPRKMRESVRVSRAEVASELVSNTWNRANRSILGVEIAAASAEFAAAKAAGRDLPSNRKIALGLKRKEWTALNTRIEEQNAEAAA